MSGGSTDAAVARQARIAHYRERIEDYYDAVRDAYRTAWGDSFHLAIFRGSEPRVEAIAATERLVADEGGFGPGMKILDVGCGVGGPALSIAEYSGAHVTGIDLVAGNVEVAQASAVARGLDDRVTFRQADAMSLPFPDAAFDHVYVLEAGCHAPDKSRFYSECARVLQPGGRFLGFEWLRGEGLTAEGEVEAIEPICEHFAVPYMITLSELRTYLVAAGLEPEWIGEAAARGNVARNWEPLEPDTAARVHALQTDAAEPGLRTLSIGGAALARAALAGAFVLGHWRARKPP